MIYDYTINTYHHVIIEIHVAYVKF